MLNRLYIKNYALIEELQVEFPSNFITITGETGAGKSILLGGLSMVLGKRADYDVLRDKSSKCIIEAEFDVEPYRLQDFFAQAELDYAPKTILRREIWPQGKSRAFVNDSPVTLELLKALSEKLIDIHSQNDTSQLEDPQFFLDVLDRIADNRIILSDYVKQLEIYKEKAQAFEALQSGLEKARQAHQYNLAAFREIEDLNLEKGQIAALEETVKELSNTEFIAEQLAVAAQRLEEEQWGVVSSLTEVRVSLNKLSAFGAKYENFKTRCEALGIEARDLSNALRQTLETLDTQPEHLERLNAQLRRIYDFQKKHQAPDEEALMQIKSDLQKQIETVEFADTQLKDAQTRLKDAQQKLDQIAGQLHNRRAQSIEPLARELEAILSNLGMPQAKFKIQLSMEDKYFSFGKDRLETLVSTNKGADFAELRKIASGGERSRVMLAVKRILSGYAHLPAIIFDEIDAGISGDMARKTAEVIKQMAQSLQVIIITHLPQMAACAHAHLKVYKEQTGEMTATKIEPLDASQRIVEIAQMLSGSNPSDSALKNARELLNY